MKCRQDFVSNSSSCSFVITGIEELSELKTCMCEALSDESENDYKYGCGKSLYKRNMKKLNSYLPSNTAIFCGDSISVPYGVPTTEVETFCKDGKIINEEKLMNFLHFIDSKYEKLSDCTGDEYEKIKQEKFEFSYIATVTENSIAILKWLKERNLLWTKEKYLDNCRKTYLYSQFANKNQFGEAVKEVDRYQKIFDDDYNRLISSYIKRIPMIYVHVNTSGDGEDEDKLFALGSYFHNVKNDNFKIVFSENF